MGYYREMPSLAKSRHWAFRVTAPWEFLKQKIPDMRKWIDYKRHAVGYHIGSKSGAAHAHVVLELKSELQKQSFDVRVKKLFFPDGSEKGNKVYSSKVWDKSLKAVSYLYHDKSGEVDVEFMNLTDAEVDEVQKLQDLYAEIKEEGKARSSNKIVPAILEEIAASERKWDSREILHRMNVGIRAETWHSPGDSRMLQYLDDILLRQGTMDDFEQASAEIVDRLLARRRW